MDDLIAKELADYLDGAYADHGSARDQLERFAAAIVNRAHSAQISNVSNASTSADAQDAARYRYIRNGTSPLAIWLEVETGIGVNYPGLKAEA